MHVSVIENLPGFLFPEEFRASLPVDFVPYAPSAKDKDRYAEGLLGLKASLSDYIYGEVAGIMKRGRIREVRRYCDGTELVRFDGRTINWDLTPGHPYQTLVHFSANSEAIAYTHLINSMTTEDGIFVEAEDCEPVCVPVAKSDWLVRKVMGLHPDEGISLYTGPDLKKTGIRIYRNFYSDGKEFDIRFFYFHLPWSFGDFLISETDTSRLVEIFAHDGYAAFLNEWNWRFLDVMGDGIITRMMGITPRLLHHRFMAEWFRNVRELELLDRIGIRDERTEPLFVERFSGTWPTIVDRLYRLSVDGGSGVYPSARELTGYDRDRILVYAALEGHSEAKKTVREKFGIAV